MSQLAGEVLAVLGIGSLAGTGVVAAVLASGATTIVAAAGNTAGISLDVGGATLPVSGPSPAGCLYDHSTARQPPSTVRMSDSAA